MTIDAPPEIDRPLLAVGIERAVKASGLTAPEFARRVMCSRTSLNHWMRGITTPSDRSLARIARAICCTQEDLRAGLPDLYVSL